MVIGMQLHHRTHRLVDVIRKVCLRRIVRHPALANGRTEGDRRDTLASPAFNLFLRLALAVRHLRLFVGRFRMAVSPRRLLTTLRMIALAVMFGRAPVALRGAFVVFRRLAVSVLRHGSPPLVCCNDR